MFRKILPAGQLEFCLQMAMARSRCPFLIGSKSDSVILSVIELIFLSDQSRSNTTVTLTIDSRING